MKRDVEDSLGDLEASYKATTPFNPSPHHCVIKSDASGAAKLCELGDVEIEMTVAENRRNSKRKAREKCRQSQSRCQILLLLSTCLTPYR